MKTAEVKTVAVLAAAVLLLGSACWTARAQGASAAASAAGAAKEVLGDVVEGAGQVAGAAAKPVQDIGVKTALIAFKNQTFIDQLKTLAQLEATVAQGIESNAWLRTAYQGIQIFANSPVLTEWYDAVSNLEGAINTAQATYSYFSTLDKVDMQRLSYSAEMVSNLARNAVSAMTHIIDLLKASSTGKNGMTVTELLEWIEKTTDELNSVSCDIETDLYELQGGIADTGIADGLRQVIVGNIYGLSPDGGGSSGKSGPGRLSNLVDWGRYDNGVTDEAGIEETASDARNSAQRVIDLVSLVIAAMAVLLLVFNMVKTNKGESYKKDAVRKVIVGLFAMIGAMQLYVAIFIH